VERYPGDFARGLFHSDGCRGVNRVRRRWGAVERWYEYPRYLFVNNSEDILRLCGQTLDWLGVAWRFSNPNTISVARKQAVARLASLSGRSTDQRAQAGGGTGATLAFGMRKGRAPLTAGALGDRRSPLSSERTRHPPSRPSRPAARGSGETRRP
jgi:hypothetical protein